MDGVRLISFGDEHVKYGSQRQQPSNTISLRETQQIFLTPLVSCCHLYLHPLSTSIILGDKEPNASWTCDLDSGAIFCKRLDLFLHNVQVKRILFVFFFIDSVNRFFIIDTKTGGFSIEDILSLTLKATNDSLDTGSVPYNTQKSSIAPNSKQDVVCVCNFN